ncbi:MAG: hypothetical protein CM1200mP10_28320 [Candidatus Neomarinimicrobiota bacterium]|nr:MAG: hypothetical protein CM1200mP10_28320 [Candidatus Neomarinimicrobiota bacterium]
MAYYVDGVYTVNPFTLGNTGTVSNNAMEQISFQSGGFELNLVIQMAVLLTQPHGPVAIKLLWV